MSTRGQDNLNVVSSKDITIHYAVISRSNHLIDFPISLARITRDASPSHAMDGAASNWGGKIY